SRSRARPAGSPGRICTGARAWAMRGSIRSSCSPKFRPLRPAPAARRRRAKRRRSEMANKQTAGQTYEAALEDLERIVEQLESGELSLEDSLAIFEKGVGLTKFCYQKLDEVEKKIEILTKDREGKLQLKDFAAADSGADE